MDRRCRTCRFWDKDNSQTGDLPSRANALDRCLFDVDPVTRQQNDPRAPEVYTSANAWCGDWQARQ